MPKVKLTCAHCGGPFYRWPSAVKRAKYCSQKCLGLARRVPRETCEECGKPYYKRPSHASSKFCSMECRSKAWSGSGNPRYNRQTYTCDNCREEYESAPSQAGRFCSWECWKEWKGENSPDGKDHPNYNRVEFTCEYCGETDIRPPSLAMRFCSKRCEGMWRSETQVGENHPHWKGGISYEPYGASFTPRLKRRIRKRDNYQCQLCGVHQKDIPCKLHVHHIDYDKKNNTPSNLISLCPSCHSPTNYSREKWRQRFRSMMKARLQQ